MFSSHKEQEHPEELYVALLTIFREAESQRSTGRIRSPTLAKHSQTKQLWEYLESAKKNKRIHHHSLPRPTKPKKTESLTN